MVVKPHKLNDAIAPSDVQYDVSDKRQLEVLHSLIEIEDKFKASEVSDKEVKDYTTNFSASEYVATEFTWESAGFFWYSQNINEVAKANAVNAVTRKINSGLAHMKEE